MAKRSLGVTMRLEGMTDLKRTLKKLKGRAITRVLRQAVNAGANPPLKATRAGAKKHVRSGLTSRSIRKKVKTYPNGNVIALIGVDAKASGKYGKRNHVPGYIWHLILRGVRPHALGKGSSIKKPGQQQTGRMHPGFAGDDFLSAAIDATRAQSTQIMETKMRQGLEREVAKAKK